MNETKLTQLRKEALSSIELRPDMKDIAVNAYLADLTKQIKKELKKKELVVLVLEKLIPYYSINSLTFNIFL